MFFRAKRRVPPPPPPTEPASALAVRHRVRWSANAVRWSLDQDDLTDRAFRPMALDVGSPARFRFVAPAGALESLDVRFGTYRRTNVGHIVCTLHRPWGTVLTSAETDLATLDDNALHPVLGLRDLAFEAGESYWIELDIAAESGNEVALYVADQDAPLRRRIEGFDPDTAMEAEAVERGLLPRYRLDWTDRGAVWATWPDVSDADAAAYEAHMLEAGTPFEFDLIAPARHADRLSVQFGTLGRRANAHIATELLGPAGEIVLRQGLSLDEVTNDTFAPVLTFGTTDLVPGRKYRVRLHWVGPEGGEVAVYAAPVAIGHYELRPHLERLEPERLFRTASWSRSDRAAATAVLIVGPGELDRLGLLLSDVRRIFPTLQPTILTVEDADRHLDTVRRADIVVFADIFNFQARRGLRYDDLCFDLHCNRVCTIFLDRSGAVTPPVGVTASNRAAMGHRRQDARRCHYVVSLIPDASVEASWPGGPAAAPVPDGGFGADQLGAMAEAVRRRSRPRVAVVSVLHRKADIIETFLEHVRNQSYPGEITTVLVDDASPDDDASRARAFASRLRDAGRDDRPVAVVANDGNLGNCASRLAGLASHDADIFIVVDCDCLMNRDFVAAHVFEHWWDDVDAVVGPLNIESNERDPTALVAALDRDPAAVKRESRPQDPVLAAGFLNCITRNFSVKRQRAFTQPLFDIDFSYSAQPGSGFGWEDVEMGYRLYEAGAVVRFTERAFTVHCTHASSIPDDRKLQGSMRNFAKLFTKHQELPLVARRWATDTYDRLVVWQATLGLPSSPERQALDRLFAEPRRRIGDALPALRGDRRRLRILTYRWHVPHQYELYKLPHDFTLATHLGSPATDAWSYDQRPLRPNARLVPFGQIDLRDYDVALLHFDENVLAAHICNGVIPASWGDVFRRFLALDGLPKVAVCHGTVPFVGQFGLDPARKYSFEPHEDERRALVDSLAAAEVRVVCNSHQALAEWGFENARVIWHGLDPQEFPRGTLARDVLALQADFSRPHYRGAWEFEEVASRLDPGIAVETAGHTGAPLENRTQNPYAIRNFRSYVDRIRQFKFYLNTTLRSPMPRSRGEAMMTGVIPVCLRNHDVDLFIDNGVDGFYADRPEELAGFINAAMKDPAMLRAMSAAARRKALDVFNHDRYLADWSALLDDVT